jgi:hypothetical protein
MCFVAIVKQQETIVFLTTDKYHNIVDVLLTSLWACECVSNYSVCCDGVHNYEK